MPIVRRGQFSGLVEISDEIGRWWPVSKRIAGKKQGAWFPDLDIKEEEKQITMRADLPSMKMEDIDISIGNNKLTISGGW